MRILATDLDRTLLPNGSWPADAGAIALFNELTQRHDVFVVYVTGRNLKLTENAISEFGIRHPHVLIGDVGTSIRKHENGEWHMHQGWVDHVGRASPKWDAEAVRDALKGVAGLSEQGREHCGAFKQSYFVDHERHETVLREVEARIRGSHDEVMIYSHDSRTGEGLLDCLPQSATKRTALEFLADELGVPRADVVFCGDSGNDIDPLTAGFSGVLVRNADDQLVAQVKQARAANPSLRAYFAKGGCRGLNGYYTSGVIEGACHYGVFPNAG